MTSKQKKGKHISGRFAIFTTILLLVCTVIFLNNQFASGSLRRISYLIFNGVRGDATETVINFDSNENNRFKLLNGNLCVISPEKLSVYKISGKATLSKPSLLRNPAVETSRSRFLAYDLGGLNFYVANSSNILFSAVSDAQILNASMNKSGDFVIVSDADDCKSLVTVYNSLFEPVYKFHSSEKYVFDAAVSPNGKQIAIASYGTTDGNFDSSLSLGNTYSDAFSASVPLGTSMPLDISFIGDNKVSVLCNDRISLFTTQGSLISETSFEGLPVKTFETSPEKQTAILLDNYQNGGNSKLILVDSNGKSSSLDISEDVYSISCCRNYFSVQLSNKCVVYKNDLSVLCEFEIPTSVIRCIVNNDGSVLCINENSATLYVE